MYLYKAWKDNGASEPWNLEYRWVFDVQFHLNQWFFGVSHWKDTGGVVWCLHIGPVAINYYHG